MQNWRYYYKNYKVKIPLISMLTDKETEVKVTIIFFFIVLVLVVLEYTLNFVFVFFSFSDSCFIFKLRVDSKDRKLNLKLGNMVKKRYHNKHFS